LLGNDSVNTSRGERFWVKSPLLIKTTTILDNEYADHNWITSSSMQQYNNTTIEKAVFSMWFAYIHFWATDMFSMAPPRDSVSSPAVNQKSAELGMREKENEASPRQSRKKGSAED
jgi:hypothetical protein